MEISKTKSVHRGSPVRVVVFVVYLVFVLVFASQIVDEWHTMTYAFFGLLLTSAYLLLAGLMNVIRVYEDRIVIQNVWQFWQPDVSLPLQEISYIQLMKAYRSHHMIVHFQEKSTQHGFKRKISITSFNYEKLEAGLKEVGISVH